MVSTCFFYKFNEKFIVFNIVACFGFCLDRVRLVVF